MAATNGGRRDEQGEADGGAMLLTLGPRGARSGSEGWKLGRGGQRSERPGGVIERGVWATATGWRSERNR